MKFRDPVSIYTASTNHDAHRLCHILVDSGIAAIVVEDNSAAGIAWVGTLPGIHQPQIWVERHNTEPARQILMELEGTSTPTDPEYQPKPKPTGPVFVRCESCERESEFPGEQFGTIQTCPFCAAYVDVGDDVDFDDWKIEDPSNN